MDLPRRSSSLNSIWKSFWHFFLALPFSFFFAFLPRLSAHSALCCALLRRHFQRKEWASWCVQRITTVCFVGNSLQPTLETRSISATAPSRFAAKQARRRVGAHGWQRRRTKTTSAAPRMSPECKHGEPLTPDTGVVPKVKERASPRRRLRYKITAQRKSLK